MTSRLAVDVCRRRLWADSWSVVWGDTVSIRVTDSWRTFAVKCQRWCRRCRQQTRTSSQQCRQHLCDGW